MEKKQPEQDAERRIAELEAEVARLKEHVPEQNSEPLSTSVHQKETGLISTSKTKIVVVATLVILIALGLIIAVFSVLSSGFDSFSHKAAQIFTPASSPKQERKGLTSSDTNSDTERKERQNSTPPSQEPVAPGL